MEQRPFARSSILRPITRGVCAVVAGLILYVGSFGPAVIYTTGHHSIAWPYFVYAPLFQLMHYRGNPLSRALYDYVGWWLDLAYPDMAARGVRIAI